MASKTTKLGEDRAAVIALQDQPLAFVRAAGEPRVFYSGKNRCQANVLRGADHG